MSDGDADNLLIFLVSLSLILASVLFSFSGVVGAIIGAALPWFLMSFGYIVITAIKKGGNKDARSDKKND